MMDCFGSNVHIFKSLRRREITQWRPPRTGDTDPYIAQVTSMEGYRTFAEPDMNEAKERGHPQLLQ